MYNIKNIAQQLFKNGTVIADARSCDGLRLSLFIFTLITLAPLTAAQWTLIPSGTTATLNDITFPSEQVGYAVGAAGTVVKTLDGGLTWSVIATDSTLEHSSVFFINEEKGFVSSAVTDAYSGLLLMTENGGMSWDTVAIEAENWLPKVHFATSELGYYTSRYGRVMRTLDGGYNWDIVLDSSYLEVASLIHCPTPDTCIFWGGPDFNGPSFRTTNGGGTFEELGGAFQSIKEALFFVDQNIGFMSGWYNPLLVKTIDGGLTWTTLLHESAWDIHFMNETTGWLCGSSHNLGAQIKHSTDGGETWVSQLDTTGSLLALDFIDHQTGFAAGYNGAIYRTENAGGTTMIPSREATPDMSVYYDASLSTLHLHRTVFDPGDRLIIRDTAGRSLLHYQLPAVPEYRLTLDLTSAGVYLYTVTGASGLSTSGRLIHIR